NKLHFNQFSLKKINEEATLEEKNGYEFTFTGNGEGAIFTLETEDKEVIQTVTVNKNSLATFTNVPVGTFYLKEKQPSSEDYVGSSETYRIISTLKGVQVYDSKGQLLGETMNEETREEEESIDQTEEPDSKEPKKDEPIVLLEIKNHLV
ncbi:prealbumin-like fold domain-containing protein, partial [Listeria monocytogenes]